MPHPLSALGIAHTVISLVPLGAGLMALLQKGEIDPGSRIGRIYCFGMLASVLTTFGLSSTGGLNPGHALGVIALMVILLAAVTPRLGFLGSAARYVRTVLMSFSFLLLMIPGTNETLSRLPADHPIGQGPDSPPVKLALACVFVLFLVGTIYQVVQLRRRASHSGRSV